PAPAVYQALAKPPIVAKAPAPQRYEAGSQPVRWARLILLHRYAEHLCEAKLACPRALARAMQQWKAARQRGADRFRPRSHAELRLEALGLKTRGQGRPRPRGHRQINPPRQQCGGWCWGHARNSDPTFWWG